MADPLRDHSLVALGRCRNLADLLVWAETAYPAESGHLRSAQDIAEQAQISARDQRPTDHDPWRACVFIILPEKTSTYGGHMTSMTVKVELSWPEREIVSILYEP